MAKSIHQDDYRILVKRLRNLRKNARVTQEELALSLGVEQSYISKVERYERRIDVIELRDICRALGTSLSSFVSGFEEQLAGQE